MKARFSFWLLVVILWVTPAWAADGQAHEAALEAGMKAFERGAFQDAVVSWTSALRGYERAGNRPGQLTTLIQLSQAESALGRYGQAVRNLEAALELADGLGDRSRLATVLAALGNVHIVIGPPETAAAYLERALALSRSLGAPALTATVLNHLGNLRATQGNHQDALTAYRESIVLARDLGYRVLAARALSNAAAALRQSAQPREAEALLDEALAELGRASPSHDMAFALVNVGLAHRDLRAALPDSADGLMLRAARAFTDAAAAA